MPELESATVPVTMRLDLIYGAEMHADDAAWASIAAAADSALMLPGLSACAAGRMVRLRDSSLRAAGLPPRQDPPGSAG